MSDPIRALTPSELTENQILSIKIRAFAEGDHRLGYLAVEAADQVGDTPARKVVCSKVNENRRHLAHTLKVPFIEAP